MLLNMGEGSLVEVFIILFFTVVFVKTAEKNFCKKTAAVAGDSERFVGNQNPESRDFWR